MDLGWGGFASNWHRRGGRARHGCGGDPFAAGNLFYSCPGQPRFDPSLCICGSLVSGPFDPSPGLLRFAASRHTFAASRGSAHSPGHISEYIRIEIPLATRVQQFHRGPAAQTAGDELVRSGLEVAEKSSARIVREALSTSADGGRTSAD